MLVAPLRNHQIVVGDAPRIADRQREAFDRKPDGPPHLDDGEPALEQLLRFVRKNVAHPLRRRPFGIIVMHARHHFADLAPLAHRVVRGSQRVVEDHDAPGAAFGFHQCFHLRIIRCGAPPHRQKSRRP